MCTKVNQASGVLLKELKWLLVTDEAVFPGRQPVCAIEVGIAEGGICTIAVGQEVKV